MGGKKRSRADKPTIPAGDLPSARRAPDAPVEQREGFVPGRPTRRPRTDTVVPEGDNQ